MSKRRIETDFDELTVDVVVPDEEDIYIQSAPPLGSRTEVFQGGKLISTASDWDEMSREIKDWMEEHKFWPSIWTVSDHGNMELANLS